MFKRRLLFFIFMLCACCAFTQDVITEMSASVNKLDVDVTESITLTVKVVSNNAALRAPQTPSLPNFNIYSQEPRRSLSREDGQIKSTQTYTYTLTSRFSGVSTIAPFTITLDDKTYKTEPIEVIVRRKEQGNAAAALAKRPQKKAQVKPAPKAPAAPTVKPAPKAPAPANPGKKLEDFFLTASVDKASVYLDQQTNLSIRFYQAQRAEGTPQYQRPKLEGLIFEDLGVTQDYEDLAGKTYLYTEFKTALFGVVPGKARVGEASVTYVPQNQNPFNIFLTSSGKEGQKVITAPIILEVKALPAAGRPDNFYGAVGEDYKISASLGKHRTRIITKFVKQ